MSYHRPEGVAWRRGDIWTRLAPSIFKNAFGTLLHKGQK